MIELQLIELRWVVPEHTTTKPPKLQYRVKFYPVLSRRGDICLDTYKICQWIDVPTVVIKRGVDKIDELLDERNFDD